MIQILPRVGVSKIMASDPFQENDDDHNGWAICFKWFGFLIELSFLRRQK